MKISYKLPYIMYKANTEEEFVQLQKKLFSDGYKWVNDMIVFVSDMITYPIYVSNLPWSDKRDFEKSYKTRGNFNEYGNDIIYFSDDKIHFDIKLQRIQKLKKIEYNENSN